MTDCPHSPYLFVVTCGMYPVHPPVEYYVKYTNASVLLFSNGPYFALSNRLR